MKTETKTEAYDYAFPAGFPQSGLTKREYFAAMAMQGLLAFENNRYVVNDNILHNPAIAKEAVLCADALIEALNAPTSTQTLNSKT